jgi:poly(3-hydroxybutyrate) depolymerase
MYMLARHFLLGRSHNGSLLGVRRNMTGKSPVLLVFAVLLLSSCQTAVNNQTSLQATWKYALVSIPKEMTTDGSRCIGTFASKRNQKCLERISHDRIFPLILFMHGCAGFGAGLGGGSSNAVTTFRSLGYAVIAPDSFARLGRKRNCAGNKKGILSLRQGEIKHALTQISKLEWVDPSRLILAGHSEGAQSVAGYGGGDVFAGYIMLGFGCTRGIGRGISTSRPVLAIQGARDPLSKGICSVGFNKLSDSIQVPKAKHDVSGYPETMAALRKFLGAVAPRE